MDRMFAPWRRAFVEGQERAPVPSPSGCIFCDYPDTTLFAGAPSSRAAWDRARYVVTRRAHAFVVLNRYPYGAGHVMVVPYTHTDELESLDEDVFVSTQRLLRETIAAVRTAYRPHGLNVGMNMGKAGGAGIAAHVHHHVLPRWDGDMNFMPALMNTKVINESLEDTYDKLAALLRRDEDDA